jgi:hypothetical protein
MVAQHHLRGGLEHRHVDRLPPAGAFAREQRRADHAEGVQAGCAIREVQRGVARHVRTRPQARLGDRDGRLDQVVEGARRRIAAALAEAEGADIDDARVQLSHRFVVEPEPLHRLRPDVVDQGIGALRELQQRLLAGRLLQVEHDAALVAVQVEEQRAGARATAGAGGAQHVAAGRLDLDHVGTEVRQHLGRRRSHDDFGDVDDAQAGERPALARVVLRDRGPRQRGAGQSGGLGGHSCSHVSFLQCEEEDGSRPLMRKPDARRPVVQRRVAAAPRGRNRKSPGASWKSCSPARASICPLSR